MHKIGSGRAAYLMFSQRLNSLLCFTDVTQRWKCV